MTEPTYDPETCVTAGQLRRLGFAIPMTVPEMGWTTKAAIDKDTDVEASESYGTHSIVSIRALGLYFQWTEAEERAPWLEDGARYCIDSWSCTRCTPVTNVAQPA